MPMDKHHRRLDRSRISLLKWQSKEELDKMDVVKLIRRQLGAPPSQLDQPDPPPPHPPHLGHPPRLSSKLGQFGPGPGPDAGPPSAPAPGPGQQTGIPTPTDPSEDESDSESEDDSSDPEEEPDHGASYLPKTTAAERPQLISSTLIENSLAPTQTLYSFSTSEHVHPTVLTSFETSVTPKASTSAIPMEASSTLTSSLEISTTSAISSASTSVSSPKAETDASGSPMATTAIIVGSLLGTVAALASIYLLFRFCAPLRTRAAAYRWRRGQRLSGEEEEGEQGGGGAPAIANEQPLRGRGMAEVTNQGALASSTIATPLPSYHYGMTVSRVPAPLPIPTDLPSEKHPFSDREPLSRSGSHGGSNQGVSQGFSQGLHISMTTSEPGASILPRYTSRAMDIDAISSFEFPFKEQAVGASTIAGGAGDAIVGTSNAPRRPHPSGLTNNPPSRTSLYNTTALREENNELLSQPTVPLPADFTKALALHMPGPGMSTPTMMPLPVHPAPHASVSSPSLLQRPPTIASPRSQHQSQYTPRTRNSITPSESVSNTPASPPSLGSELSVALPPLRILSPFAVNSRWSRNSSSVHNNNDDEGDVGHGSSR